MTAITMFPIGLLPELAELQPRYISQIYQPELSPAVTTVELPGGVMTGTLRWTNQTERNLAHVSAMIADLHGAGGRFILRDA